MRSGAIPSYRTMLDSDGTRLEGPRASAEGLRRSGRVVQAADPETQGGLT